MWNSFSRNRPLAHQENISVSAILLGMCGSIWSLSEIILNSFRAVLKGELCPFYYDY